MLSSPYFRHTSWQPAYIISFFPCFLLPIEANVTTTRKHYIILALLSSPHFRHSSSQLACILSFSQCFLLLISDAHNHNEHTLYHSPHVFFTSFQTYVITASKHDIILFMFSSFQTYVITASKHYIILLMLSSFQTYVITTSKHYITIVSVVRQNCLFFPLPLPTAKCDVDGGLAKLKRNLISDIRDHN